MDENKSELLMLFGWVFAIMLIAVLVLYPYKNYQFTTIGISDGVNLYSCKYVEPAPMGIVDYGVSSYGNVYNISTNSVQASIIDNRLLTNLSGNYNASLQLNSNLLIRYENYSQVYYLQNVILIDSKTNSINFIDNVWNNSGINASMHSKRVEGNGTIAPSIKNETYYFYQSSNENGDNITIKNNQTVYLRTNSTINKKNEPEVIFSYNDGYGWKEYDKVIFPNIKTENASILISGFNYTPSYNFYDLGIVIGGPGGGLNTTVVNGSISFILEYWNGNNFQVPQDTYDFGCNTEEGINNAVVTPSFNKYGIPFANITSGKNIYLGNLWSLNSSNIAILYINNSIKNSYVSIYNNQSYINESLLNGIGKFTLESGNYIVNVYKNGIKIYNKTYSLIKGKTNYLNII